jgi:hypothetical protein
MGQPASQASSHAPLLLLIVFGVGLTWSSTRSYANCSILQDVLSNPFPSPTAVIFASKGAKRGAKKNKTKEERGPATWM